MRLISVAMGYENPIIRNQEAAELLSYGFSFYKKICFLDKDDIVKKYDTILYENNLITICPTKSFVKTILKSETDKYEIKYEFSSKTEGTAILYYDEKVIDTADLVVKESKKKNLFKLFLEILGSIF